MLALTPWQEGARVAVLSVIAIATAAGAKWTWGWLLRAVRRDLREAVRDEVEPIVAEHVERIAAQLRDDGNGSFRNVVVTRLAALEATLRPVAAVVELANPQEEAPREAEG